jgi:hypothetical protein
MFLLSWGWTGFCFSSVSFISVDAGDSSVSLYAAGVTGATVPVKTTVPSSVLSEVKTE